MAARFPNCICCIGTGPPQPPPDKPNDCCGVLFEDCLTITITSDCPEFDGQTIEICFDEDSGCWIGTLNLIAGQKNCGIWTFKFCCSLCEACVSTGTDGPATSSTTS